MSADQKQAFYNQGLEYYSQQKYDEAIEEYKKAIEVDPQDGELYLAVSMTYDRKAELDNALEYARKAVDFMPREPLAYTNLSRIFQKKGMIPEAEDAMAISKQIASGMM
ncbi:MAG: tetratricopeptide repeat protein [Candidatus Hinthialibacter antarcticus]|nr:tetratricopeptide repeat protein [Candidatus Hinthialibacter antarcticus]